MTTKTERIEQAAAALSALELEVLVLSAGRHWTVAEIALSLGLSEARVERLLARATRKFDRALHRRRAWWRFL